MHNPLVSIIIPVFNGADYLEESIQSALAQTYQNIEIIVVNDGSNDAGATENVAKSFGNQIRYFSKPNGGVSSALNFGIQNMRGEFVSWLSHDDLYHPDKIKIQVERYLKEIGENKVIFSDSELINKTGNRIRISRSFKNDKYTSDEMFNLLFSGKSLNGCSLLIPKSLFNQAGVFDERFRYIQDWKMWVIFCLNEVLFIKTHNVLVKMRVHENQQTLKINKLLPIETEVFLNELLEELAGQPDKKFKKIEKISRTPVAINNKKIKEECLKLLNQSPQYSTTDKLNYFFAGIVKPAKTRIKKIYHKVLRKVI